MPADIIPFRRPDAEQVTPDAGIHDQAGRFTFRMPETEGNLLDTEFPREVGIDYVVPDTIISTKALYPPSDLPRSPLSDALRNLDEALEYIDSALKALECGEFLSADDKIIHFQGILPELFCSRSLGDGFGMVINAMMIALRNDDVTPLEEKQIRAIRISLIHLMRKPLLSENEAVNLLERLDQAGLETDPPELDFVADLPR
jgi:hypothetical protein